MQVRPLSNRQLKHWSAGISGTSHVLLVIGMASIAWNPERAWEFSVAKGKSAMLSVSFAQQVATSDAPVPVVFVESEEFEELVSLDPKPISEDAEEKPEPRTIEVEATEIDRASAAMAPFPTMASLEDTALVPQATRRAWENSSELHLEPRQRLTRRETPNKPPEVTPPIAPSTRKDASEAAVAEADPGAVFDEPPAKLPENKAPDYPIAARLAGVEGRVLLSVRIDTSGKVSQVHVDQSSGHSLLDQSALEAVRFWRFSPAKRKGSAVEAEVLVPVRFTLRTT
jgi:periplasmic protein TonB